MEQGLGNVGVWDGLEVLGQSRRALQSLKVSDAKAKGGERADVPQCYSPPPFSVSPEGATLVTLSGQEKDRLRT